MSLSLVVARLVALVSDAPDAPVSPAHAGAMGPHRSSDLPRVAVSLGGVRPGVVGLGRIVREGEAPGTRDDLVPVTRERGFSDDLRELLLPATPLGEVPGAAPVLAIADVTDPAQPRAYRAVNSPAALDEFRLDPVTARVRFGAPQRAGASLALRYRARLQSALIRAIRLRGSASLEVWAGTPEQVAALVEALERRLADASLARQRGFWRLQPQGMTTPMATRVDTGETPPFVAWRNELTCDFSFEAEDERSDGEGGVIRRVDVDITGSNPDGLVVPSSPST